MTPEARDSVGISRAGSRRRVLVVEDHAATRMALAALIGAEADLTVCGEAATLAGALEELDSAPEIVLVDLHLGPDSGFALLAALRDLAPEIPALVVSSLDPEVYGERVRAAGAVGFVPKQDVAVRLLDAIRAALNGGPGH